VAFLYVNASPQDGRDAARDEVATYGFEAPYVLDPVGDIAGPLQLRVSSEVVVIDRSGTLRYRGAVDDQHGIDFALAAPRQQYLRTALDAVLDRRPVQTAKTEASGCLFPEPRTAVVPARPLDWHTRVSRIVQTNCVSCHRAGGVAPFSLETWEQATGFRAIIRQVLADGRMPPWFAHPQHGEWSNGRSARAEAGGWQAAGARCTRAGPPGRMRRGRLPPIRAAAV
jgi:mono/diheme cytochrome c family protein